MKITLKLFADLDEYLPADARGNAVEVEAQEITANAVLARYKLPPAAIRVVMLNGNFLPEDQRDAQLQDGDVLAAWPTIQGG